MQWYRDYVTRAPKRSPLWPKARRAYKKTHPACEACGRKIGVQVHHVIPFHLHPEKELDPENFIALCGKT
jgi:5-methylcytosine-specific restriction endonuclease McrA